MIDLKQLVEDLRFWARHQSNERASEIMYAAALELEKRNEQESRTNRYILPLL